MEEEGKQNHDLGKRKEENASFCVFFFILFFCVRVCQLLSNHLQFLELGLWYQR